MTYKYLVISLAIYSLTPYAYAQQEALSPDTAQATDSANNIQTNQASYEAAPIPIYAAPPQEDLGDAFAVSETDSQALKNKRLKIDQQREKLDKISDRIDKLSDELYSSTEAYNPSQSDKKLKQMIHAYSKQLQQVQAAQERFHQQKLADQDQKVKSLPDGTPIDPTAEYASH